MKASNVTLIFSVALLLIVTSNVNWYSVSWKDFLESDAKGYYAYLPATVVYQDLNFGFFDEIERVKYKNASDIYDYRKEHDGFYINKYYCGTAFVLVPFYLIAHWLSILLGYDLDGYSYLYAIFQTIGAVFYCALGLFFLARLLSFYRINETNKSITLIALLFGSNLFYYTVGELGMSHVYSFAFVAGFIFFIKRYFEKTASRDIILASIFLGIIILIRPVNGLIICLIPFLAGSYSGLKRGFLALKKHFLALIISAIVCCAIVSIQLFIYKIQTGSFFIYSYDGEGFNFLNPQIFDFLFSYKKGLFVYTPMCFLALFGLIPLYKKSRFQFYSLVEFLIVVTYVLSSWWCWYYGGSFSTRVFVEYLPVFALLLAISLQYIKEKVAKIAIRSFIVVLIVVCQIQTFQYRYYEIHWAEMTKEMYWDVFLRVDKLMEK